MPLVVADADQATRALLAKAKRRCPQAEVTYAKHLPLHKITPALAKSLEELKPGQREAKLEEWTRKRA